MGVYEDRALLREYGALLRTCRALLRADRSLFDLIRTHFICGWVFMHIMMLDIRRILCK